MIPFEIIIKICEFDNNIPIEVLNKKFNNYYKNKKIKDINKIKKFYLLKKLHFNSNFYNNFTIDKVPKNIIVRDIIKNIKGNRMLRMFIILPEFICLQKNNINITQKMRQLPEHDYRKKSQIVNFLLEKDISNYEIVNAFRIIERLE